MSGRSPAPGGLTLVEALVNTLDLESGADTLDTPDGRARLGITETRTVAGLVNLTGMTPSGALSSTGWALAGPSAGEYVVYAPSGGSFSGRASPRRRRRLATRS